MCAGVAAQLARSSAECALDGGQHRGAADIVSDLLGSSWADLALGEVEVGHLVVLPHRPHDAEGRLLVEIVESDVDGGQHRV